MKSPLSGTFVAAVALLAQPAVAQQFSVAVDGKPLVFAGGGPVRLPEGSLMVPLRGIFEALGATVKFDVLTRSITAVRGETTVLLRLGESVGHVNQTPVPLSVPAQSVGGTTRVPLRFIAEAFGASVKWDPATKLVSISTAKTVAPAAGAGTVAIRPVEVAPPTTGVVDAIDPATRSVSVKTAAGAVEAVVLAETAVVLIGPEGGEAVRRDIAALRRGDQVVVKARDAQGHAIVVEASYGEVAGTVETVVTTPDGLRLLLVGGKTVDLRADVRTGRIDPASKQLQPSAVSEISKGDQVTVRTSPADGRPGEVTVVPAPSAPVPVAEITRVQHNGVGKWLRSGDALTITVEATPGIRGTVRLPGIDGADAVALVEATPGRYTTTVPLPPGLFAKDRVAEATFVAGPNVSRSQSAGEPYSIDTTAPVPGTFVPAAGTQLVDRRPNITGTYTDDGSGVDARQVRIRIDKVDVTAKATVADAFFAYKPDTDLGTGIHQVEVDLVDVAGNTVKREWAFTIDEPAPVKSFRALPDDRPLDYGDIVVFTVDGAPGAKSATVKLGAKVDITLREDKPGNYVGTYTVRKEDVVRDAIATLTLVLADGRAVVQTLDRQLTLTAGVPAIPLVELPQEGASVGGAVVFTGRTLPGAQVRISLRWQGRKGGVVNAAGTFPEVTVVADAKGRWISPDIELVLPRDINGALFTADIVAVGTAGMASAPATVRFRK